MTVRKRPIGGRKAIVATIPQVSAGTAESLSKLRNMKISQPRAQSIARA
jgi:hypothetical protein